MFVDTTPNNEVNILRANEERSITLTEMKDLTEKSGMKIIDTVRPSNQLRKNCKESKCIACKDSPKFVN